VNEPDLDVDSRDFSPAWHLKTAGFSVVGVLAVVALAMKLFL
jgi:hypothetical protein